MEIKSAEFVTSATRLNQYPGSILPEIAFVGYSNVGKSSLINTLVNRKRLVKTSSTPGKTRLINFFVINNSISFVDLPGYGYAKVCRNIKNQWKKMIEIYFKSRINLRATVLVMDIRRNPKKLDADLLNWLDLHNTPVLKVLTKTDKLSKNKVLNQLIKFKKEIWFNKSDSVLFSAKTKIGRELLWSSIEDFIKE